MDYRGKNHFIHKERIVVDPKYADLIGSFQGYKIRWVLIKSCAPVMLLILHTVLYIVLCKDCGGNF